MSAWESPLTSFDRDEGRKVHRDLGPHCGREGHPIDKTWASQLDEGCGGGVQDSFLGTTFLSLLLKMNNEKHPPFPVIGNHRIHVVIDALLLISE